MLGQSGATNIQVDLAGAPAIGDAQADTVIANAGAGADSIDVLGSGTSYAVTGLAVPLNVAGSEGAIDTLVVNGLGGDDAITATTLPAGVVRLILDGGAGSDTLLGSQGADLFLGGDGDDFVFGDNGNDTAFLGAGADQFQWNPGDGNDTIEGQGDTDLLLFNGSSGAETINIAANGGRVLFLRDVANVTMDLDDVEQIRFAALGGADAVVIGDMSGTDLDLVEVRLGASGGGGDGQPDRVTVNATQGADVFGVAGSGSDLSVFGLAAETRLVDAEATDILVLNGLAGADVIDASSLAAGRIVLQVNGGLGNDIVLGSAGDDLVIGGDGDDTALLGDGNDTFVWNPGDDNDVLEGQAGAADRLLFNGANIAENITISANGGRALFFRDIANVVMDLNDVEVIEYNALGGADTINVNDLSGTDVNTVRINLAATGGGGDGQVDTIVINATAGDDVIILDNDANGITVLGLGAGIFITGFEATDRIIINTLGGEDVVDGSALDATVAFRADGGDDDDVLVGGEAADTLLGGLGDDILIGNGGVDVLDGGAGSNVVIQ